ncbi:hypothetical protein ACEWY4_006361 [Coilia grayii]|uniref:G-protein coupled receptors family 1 profile domain-containing protein n=1 Tax=Coilia grayii TaxID=363190 RepID=A0ABD1KD73_9TELE
MATNRTGLCPLPQEEPAYYTHILGVTVDWIIVVVGLPGIITAIYALQGLVRADHVAPVFVINLLVSDLFQIAITVVFILSRFFDRMQPVFLTLRCISRIVVRLGITASLCFMVCISAERYLTVAHPIWYRYRRTVKCSVVISSGVWGACALYALLDFAVVHDQKESLKVFSVLLLLPALPLTVFCSLTHKALQHCRSIQQNESRRIMGALGLVLGIYAVLFLPFCIRNLYFILAAGSEHSTLEDTSLVVTSALVYLSPLADPFLYIFMRRDMRNALDILLSCRGLLRHMVNNGEARSEDKSQQTAEMSATHIQDTEQSL